MKKYKREMLRELPRGYTIGWPRVEGRPRGSQTGHPYVLDPDGEIARMPDGSPVRICSSGNGGSHASDLRRMRDYVSSLGATA